VKFRDEVEDSAIDSLAVSIAILDVDNHRRFLSDAIDVTTLPPLLINGVTWSRNIDRSRPIKIG
jgi:hypothetical protein